jgi:Tol biopolymer transport system component
VGTIVAAHVYDGVHVIDVATGTDRQLPAPPARAPTTKAGLVRTAVRLFRQEQRIFGCGQPQTLSWSPDGSRLAYACIASRNGEQSARIYTIRPDGTGRRLLRTHTAGAYWPSWSPDGKEIAFSSGEWPSQSAIYTIDLDGAHQHFVTTGAAPDWSPDGTAIAYRGASCAEPPDGGGEFASVRLVTASGRDITPVGYRRACRRFGPFFSPIPAWSPDGRRLAISTTSGLYVGNRDGSSFRRFALDPGRGLFGLDRPAWQPHPRGGTK